MPFNWEEIHLRLPMDDDPKATMERLDDIHKDMLRTKGLILKPSQNSPGFVPSAEQARQVSTMACLGLGPKDIALVLNIEEKLLTLYYKRELRVTHNLANMMVARQALEMAMSGRFPDMTKFWLKSRAGWTEKNESTLTIKDGSEADADGNTAKDRLRDVLAKGAKPLPPVADKPPLDA